MKKKLIDILCLKFNLDIKTAKAFIMAGKVIVNDQKVTKSGVKIDNESIIRLKSGKKYVSRGAYKLEEALKSFDIVVKDKICVDVGSSTGGFTEVLLNHGASQVYAVDCGTNQLDYSLRVNPKVISIENKKIQIVKKDEINNASIAVSDVSFTTILPIIKYLYKNLCIRQMIILIKPQFEYEALIDTLDLSGDFTGIVKSDLERDKILQYITNEIKNIPLIVDKCIESPIKGTKGNIEYLVYIKDIV